MIMQALEVESKLRYIDIQEKINLRCERLSLKKPSTETLANHLYILRKKDVLVREVDRFGGTHYSLKYNHYASYVEEILSLHKKRGYVYSYNLQFDYEKSLKIIEPSEKYFSQDKKTLWFNPKTIFHLFIPIICSLLSISGFIFCSNG